MSIKNLFNSLIQHLSDQRRRFCIIGAFAMFSYGYERATRDIDIAMCTTEASDTQAWLETLGFQTLYKTEAFISLLHPIEQVRIDIMLLDEKTGEKVFDKSENRVVFGDIKAPIVNISHLIEMKAFAASQDPDRTMKDISDIKELIKNNPGIRRDTVSEILSKYRLDEYISHVF